MPEHLRALVVILAIALVFFWQSASVTSQVLADEQQHRRWRNAWLAMTLIAFLTPNFWLFCVLYVLLVYWCNKKEDSPLAVYLFLLAVVPPISALVPGFGIVNYLVVLSPLRLLALVVLLPAAFALAQYPGVRFGKLLSDKLVLAFVLLSFVLDVRGTTTTDAMRGLLYSIAGVLLPYYVASRSLKQMEHFRKALYAYVLSVGLISAIASFEMLRHWLLYSSLASALGADAAMGNYLGRADLVRAMATTGQPLALGFMVAVALGCFLYLQGAVKSTWDARKVWLVIGAGLIAALSRGPWVGAVVMLVAFILTGPGAAANTARLAAVAVVGLALAAVLPGGEKVINLIPFVGKTEVENIDYRSRLIDNAMIVINRDFWLGSVNYLETPEMLSMIQGQGIIDVVNSYLEVALAYGMLGLALFSGFFLVVLLGLCRIVSGARDKSSEEIRLGRALLATWVGIIVIILTTSSISFIPYVYWTVGGIAVAYIQMMKNRKEDSQNEQTA